VTEISVEPDSLRGAGQQLDQVAQRFTQELTALQADLAGFGAPWGGDDIGSLIGAAYEEVVSYAFDCYQSVLDEIGDSGADLGGMADMYEEIEEKISSGLRALQQRLGG
jgi:hypothetical protein